MINENKLLKQLNGTASPELCEEVFGWIAESPANRQKYIDLKNKWVLANTPDTCANIADAELLISRIRRRKRRNLAISLSAAAVILFGIVYCFESQISYYYGQLDFIESQGLAFTEYTTNKGVKGKVLLPDGSTVWLNSDSRLCCPNVFTGDTRDLTFTGEGFFDIKTDPEHPMVISLNDETSIRVTGTKFNLKSHKNDNSISALLLEGRISMVKNKREVVVEPNEELCIEKSKNKCTIETPEETFSILGWKDGWLVFDDMPMTEVFKSLERWHGVSFVVKDRSVLEKRFTARFKEESIAQILELMTTTNLLQYSIQDSTVTIEEYK